MDPDSDRVSPPPKWFSTRGLRSAEAAPLEPTNCSTGTEVSEAGSARGAGTRPSPAEPKQANRGTPGWVRSLLQHRKGNDPHGHPLAPSPFPESHPTTETQRSRKFRNRNCKHVSRSLGTVSQASRRRLRTPHNANAVKGRSPGGGGRSAPSPSRPRGISLGCVCLVGWFLVGGFRVKVPDPRLLERPESSSPPPVPGRWSARLFPLLPTRKGNWGPKRILWNVLCNRLCIRFHRTARCKIPRSETLEGTVRLSAATSGGGGEGSRLKPQFTSTEPC